MEQADARVHRPGEEEGFLEKQRADARVHRPDEDKKCNEEDASMDAPNDEEESGEDLQNEVDEWLEAFERMHMHAHNVSHYMGDYSTKFSETVGRLVPALAMGVENLETGCGSISAPVTDDSADAVVDAYVNKRLGASGGKVRKPRETFDQVLERGRRLLIRLQTSSNKTSVKKLTEMMFQLLYGHECYLSHRTWTLFCKRPVNLAYLGLERRRRRYCNEDFNNLDDYVPPTCREEAEGAEGGPQAGAVAEQGALRASVAEEDDEEEGEGNVLEKGQATLDSYFPTRSQMDSRTGSEEGGGAAMDLGGVVVGLGRSCRQFENWLLRGRREPLASMGLYHYAMYVYESYGTEPVADFATYLYDALHPSCAKWAQKLRVDEAYCVPRLSGITFTACGDDPKQRNHAALQKLMLFKPLALPLEADALDEAAMLEMLGEECDCGEDATLSYEPAWQRWFDRQRELAAQLEALQRRTGVEFKPEHIDTGLTGEEGLDGARIWPSAAEFMAWRTVEVVSNIESAAKARSAARTDPRPDPAKFEPVNAKLDEEQLPAGPSWGAEVDAGPRDDPKQMRATYPLTSKEVATVSLLEDIKTRDVGAYKRTFLERMGRWHAPSAPDLGSDWEPFVSQRVGDEEAFREHMRTQREFLEMKKAAETASAEKKPDTDAGDGQLQHHPRPLPTDVAEVPAHVQEMTADLNACVQELLDEFAAPKDKKVVFKKEQLAFIERVVDHLAEVIAWRRLGEKPKQRVFLLLGQGGCGKSEIIQFLRRLVDRFYTTLAQRTGRPGEDGCGPSSILVAGTNAAAANIGGDTIHSRLILPGSADYSLKALAQAKVPAALVNEWHDVHLLVVDEISMLSPALFGALSFRVCQARKETWGVSEGLFTEKGSAFGGVPIVILAGDFMQLPAMEGRRRVSLLGPLHQEAERVPAKPTRQPTGRKPPRDYFNELLQGRRCFNESVTDVHVLKTSYRFKDKLLPRIFDYMRSPRGELMPHDLWEALRSRVVEGPDDARLKDPSFEDGFEVATQWEAVARLMQYRARRDARRARQLLLYVQAVDTPKECTMAQRDYKRALQLVSYCQTGNRVGLLPLFVGMRVRLTRKLNAKYGLVNEKPGVVQGFEFHANEFLNPAHDWVGDRSHEAWQRGYVCLQYLPKAVYVKFDKCSMDWGFGPGVVAIEPSVGDKLFELHLHADDNERHIVGHATRFQLPLMPEQVRTTQTAQGKSMERLKAMLAKGNMSVDEWWLNVYVMLSRAITLDGLLLFELPNRDFFCRGPPAYVAEGLPRWEQRAEREMVEAAARLEQKHAWVKYARDLLSGAESVTAPVAVPESDASVAAAEVMTNRRDRGRQEVGRIGADSAKQWASPEGDGLPAKRSRTTPPHDPNEVGASTVRVPEQSGAAAPPSERSTGPPSEGSPPQREEVNRLPPGLAALRPCIGEEDISPHHFLLQAAVNVFGVRIPAAGGDLYYGSMRHQPVGSPNLGNTCFVNAAMQVMLRLQPLHRLLVLHKCSNGFENCAWCCLRVQSIALRRETRLDGCPLAVMARRGRFGVEYALKERVQSVRNYADHEMLPLHQARAAGGALKKGRPGDPAGFFLSVLETLAWEERGMSGYVRDRTRSVVLHELFGFIIRERGHCSREECHRTRDRCDFAHSVLLSLPGGHATVELRDLWERRWGEFSDEGATCCGRHAGQMRQDFVETEPTCLVIQLRRGEAQTDRKVTQPVSFPQRLDWMRTGDYELCGIIFHHGETITDGHCTAACALDRATGAYAHFNDSGVSRKQWGFFAKDEQRQDAYLLLYTRVSTRGVLDGDAMGSLPYAVGPATERLLRERGLVGNPVDRPAAGAVPVEVVLLDGPVPDPQQRAAANRQKAIERRAAKRARLEGAVGPASAPGDAP